MVVYVVFSLQRDAEYNEIEVLEHIFSSKTLAENFVNHEIGSFRIEEISVLIDDLSSTKNTMQKVKEGKILMKNGSMIFK